MPSLTGLDAMGELPSGGPARHQARELWICEHLRHLDQIAHAIPGPAAHVAEERLAPWWHS